MEYVTTRRCILPQITKSAAVVPELCDSVSETEIIFPKCKDKSAQYKNKIDEICKNNRWLWNKASRGFNPYETVPFVTNERKISRAYYKMWEILVDSRMMEDYTDTTKPISFLHLCEGPGGFIQACREYREKLYKDEESINNDIHVGITLKPEKNDENLPDFSDDIPTVTNCYITYGQDGTGDLYNVKNIKGLEKNIESITKKPKCNIITADGGFDVSTDFNNQEQLSLRLFISQTLAALETQEINGHFVMKIFDVYSRGMVDLLYILRLNYKVVYIYKPDMSRPCNSEFYVVCLLFNGCPVKSHITKLYTLLNKLKENVWVSSILKKPPPVEFINSIGLFMAETTENQTRSIQFAIDNIKQGKAFCNSKINNYKEVQKQKAMEYCENNKLLI